MAQAGGAATVLAALMVVTSCGAGENNPRLSPAQLGFAVTPSIAPAGVAMKPAVQVAIQDVHGNTVASATNTVTVTLASNSVGATLSGTTTVNAVNGVATFGDLSIDKPGAAYALTASSPELASATSASFAISPPPAVLHVTTTTTGASLPASYALSIDCDSYGCAYKGPIEPNAALTVPVQSGSNFVALDVADNCTVSGDATRTVTASGTTDVPFAVECAATGTLTVTTSTSGTDLYPEGYSVCVDRSGDACYWRVAARVNDAITIARVRSGPHTVTLADAGGNCAVAGGASQRITVPADGSVSASFSVNCALAERIAFLSGGTISMVHTDGTAAHRIATGFAPAWSPDGTRLAYECVQDICIINADGTGSTVLTTSGAGGRHPTWSPDGLKIAFAANAAGTTELHVVVASGGTPVRLTHGVGFLGAPTWSPDGTQIAFDCQVDAGNADICVVRSDGTGFTRLTTDPARDYGAAWKPDGSTLAFVTTRFGVDEIALMNVVGGSVTRIGAGLPGFEPTWSPDGTQLGFVQLGNDPSSGPYASIVVARTDGSNLHAVIQGTQPAWRPHR